MLIIDEISFMNKHTLNDLDLRMRDLGKSDFAFGGFPVIIAGDFYQFEPVKRSEEHLIFFRESDTRFEQKPNTIFILSNEHQLRLDVMWGNY